MNEWLLLTATLPASPSALRVRTWRALKATGAGMLRDGVYLLPATAPSAPSLWQLDQAIRDGGADATLLVVTARDAARDAAFRTLFDRTDLYDALLQSVKQARAAVRAGAEAELRKTLRGVERELESIQGGDFFPGKAAGRAAAALATLRGEIERRLSPGEPLRRGDAVRRRASADFQRKTWVTRKRPWVDRLATAWLVVRFVDRTARFAWIDGNAKVPKGAVGFDFDGATFTHVGEKVTFETVLHAFGLEADPALVRLGELVHCIDVGGIPVDAAAGVETIVRGLLARHADDDRLLAAALPLFDSLYAGLGSEP